jgi:hypothetical protein
MMMVNPVQIARLLLRSRITAWRRVAAGAYGPVVRGRGRVCWVGLRAVAAAEGVVFSEAQLAAAGVRLAPEIEQVAA